MPVNGINANMDIKQVITSHLSLKGEITQNFILRVQRQLLRKKYTINIIGKSKAILISVIMIV